jgi:hypothetical protein
MTDEPGDPLDNNDIPDDITKDAVEGATEGTGGGTMNGMSGEGPVDGPADDQDSRFFGDEPAGTDAGATRANGLTAAYYVPLRDVDPRLGFELLTKLADAGIAAYVAPTPGRQGGYGDVKPPSLPTDRLWVDGAQRSEAEAVIAGTISEDEVFEQLVAMFHTSAPAEVPWPATEELSAPTTRSQTWTTRRSITARQAPIPEITPAEQILPSHVESYLDEHFVPEPPPPLPRLQPITILAWALIGLGILAIVLHDYIPLDFAQGSIYIAACAIVGGFATLVYRMRDNDEDNDGDGAVV